MFQNCLITVTEDPNIGYCETHDCPAPALAYVAEFVPAGAPAEGEPVYRCEEATRLRLV